MKTNHTYRRVAIIALLVLTALLTIGLRGTLPDKTYLVVEAKDYMGPPIYPIPSQPSTVENFSSGFGKWFPSGEVSPNVTTTNGMLYLTASFPSLDTTQAAVMQQRVNISIFHTPLFSMRLFAPEGLRYGVRFWGIGQNGSEVPIWYQTSPLEHRPGNGWEKISVDLRSYSLASTGDLVDNLTRIYLYMEAPPSSAFSGPQSLILQTLSFSQVRFFDQPLGPGFQTYVSIIGSIPQAATGNWKLERVLFYVKATATPQDPLTYAVSVTNLHDPYEATSASYNYAVSPGEEADEILQVNTYVPTSLPFVYVGLTGNLAIVFSTLQGSFQSLDVNSVQLIFTTQGLSWSVQPDPNQAALSTALLMTGILAMPMAGLVSMYYAREKLSTRQKLIVILVGSLVLRFALATFTGHAWDMEQWTQTARRYYESGQFTLQSFPTLPVYYFLLLGSYSWYALLRLAGLPDITFMFLPTRAIESIFIKAPSIVADAVSTVMVYRILRSSTGNEKATWYASLFALNPLTILVSSVWGMYDSIMVAFLLIGIEQWQKKSHVRSSVSLILSALTKLVGTFTLVILDLELLFNKRVFKLMTALGVCAVIAFTLLYLQLGEFFYVTFVERIFGLSAVVRSPFGGLSNPFGNPSQYALASLGFSLPTLFAYAAFTLVLLLSVGIFVKLREKNVVEAAVLSTLTAVIGYYLSYPYVYLQHYVWIIPLLIIYLSFKRSNIAGVFPTLFGFVTVLLGVASTVSFGYFVTGVPYIQILALEGYHHHIVVFGLVMILMLAITIVPLWARFNNLSTRLASLYLLCVIADAFSIAYILIPARIG